MEVASDQQPLSLHGAHRTCRALLAGLLFATESGSGKSALAAVLREAGGEDLPEERTNRGHDR
jgi:hypothetical protein